MHIRKKKKSVLFKFKPNSKTKGLCPATLNNIHSQRPLRFNKLFLKTYLNLPCSLNSPALYHREAAFHNE